MYFFVLVKSVPWSRNGILRNHQGVVMRKPVTDQYKVNLDSGQVYMVGSKASDKPVKEQQASLLDWGEDRERLEQWQDISEERSEL
jgi:hypothetical protein